MNAAWVERAEKMRADGMSYRKIGIAVGRHDSTVHRALNPSSKERMQDYRAQWTATKREHLAEYKASWYADHEQSAKSRSRAHYAQNYERTRANNERWKREHPEEYKAAQRSHYERNQETIIARSHARYEAKRDEILEQNKQYRAAHPGKVLHWSAARRARVRGAEVPTDREAVAMIYREARMAETVTCYLCGAHPGIGNRHVDHIVPLARGGKHEAANLAIACKRCNLVKSDKLCSELAMAR
ncbi:MAG: HNH endonuclease signature motif containing protein [Parcubacteria group bacterium]|jgi:5-methylcytosine-specific restriction endonuclease McrA